MKIIVVRVYLIGRAAIAYLPGDAQQVSAHKAKPNYEVRGQLSNAPAGTRVYITDFVSGKHVPLESAVTDAAGRFRIQGLVTGPVLLNLRVPGREQSAGVALAPGSHLQVRGDAAQLWRTGEVTGSAEAVALSAMNREYARILKRVDELDQQRQGTTDTTALRKIEQEGASWCKPCREKNPSLVRLYRQYQPKGFEVCGVSVDNKQDAWTTAI